MAKRKRRAPKRSQQKPEPRTKSKDPITAARQYGVDIGQLQENLRLTVAERLARLDAYAADVRELRCGDTPARPLAGPHERPRESAPFFGTSSRRGRSYQGFERFKRYRP